MPPGRTRAAAVLALAALLGVACSDDDGNGEATAPTSTPTTSAVPESTTAPPRTPTVDAATLEGPITVGTPSPPADPRPVDLAAIGYVEEEWFASGTAASFTAVGELGADGRWTVEPAGTAPYKTRFVVRRPAEPSAFSGAVVVEWLNVSAVEASPDWSYTGAAIVDDGAAWVGVSVQAFGVVGGQSLLDTGSDDQAAASGGIRNTNPERYGTLEHPGDAYAFDIYSQIGAALRSGAAVFGGARVSAVVAAGESQSAGFLTTYVNAVQPIAGVYDGFFVHSRGGGAAQLDGNPAIRGSEVAYQIRDDVGVPVLVFETETDVGPLLRYAPARQPDTDLLRVWEVAGTAHADAYLVGRNFGLCPGGINDGPQHYVAKAAVAALLAWIVDGVEPPHGEPITTDAPDSTTIVRDDHGIARGGIRTPSVDVPVSALSGEGPPGAQVLCLLFGSSTPFDAATLTSLYPTRDDYLAQFDAALDEAIENGFVRAADRDEYAAEARAVVFP